MSALLIASANAMQLSLPSALASIGADGGVDMVIRVDKDVTGARWSLLYAFEQAHNAASARWSGEMLRDMKQSSAGQSTLYDDSSGPTPREWIVIIMIHTCLPARGPDGQPKLRLVTPGACSYISTWRQDRQVWHGSRRVTDPDLSEVRICSW